MKYNVKFITVHRLIVMRMMTIITALIMPIRAIMVVTITLMPPLKLLMALLAVLPGVSRMCSSSKARLGTGDLSEGFVS